jgi:hypothetical protein
MDSFQELRNMLSNTLRNMTVNTLHEVNETERPLEFLVIFTVVSVIESEDSSPMLPLLTYALETHRYDWDINTTYQDYKHIPIISNKPEDLTWVKALEKTLTLNVPELITYYGGDNGPLGDELRRFLNGQPE